VLVLVHVNIKIGHCCDVPIYVCSRSMYMECCQPEIRKAKFEHK
jgi:hypothetical protein